MSLQSYLYSQFSHPHGPMGHVAAWAMHVKNRERNNWAIEIIAPRPTDSILEIGFGPGYAIRKISEIARSGFVTGIDSSPEMLKQAERRNRAAIREGRVELHCGSIKDLAFSAAPFDKILAVNSHPFWDDALNDLAMLRRLLKPEGIIALVLQPRCKTDTCNTVELAKQQMIGLLSESGFQKIRTMTKPMKPVECLCGIGTK